MLLARWEGRHKGWSHASTPSCGVVLGPHARAGNGKSDQYSPTDVMLHPLHKALQIAKVITALILLGLGAWPCAEQHRHCGDGDTCSQPSSRCQALKDVPGGSRK